MDFYRPVAAVILRAGLTLTACSAPAWTGTVSGRLLLRSGTAGMPDQPVSGTLIIGTPTVGHYGEWIPVDSSGAFNDPINTAHLPNNWPFPIVWQWQAHCYASPRTITITMGSTTVRDVICISPHDQGGKTTHSPLRITGITLPGPGPTQCLLSAEITRVMMGTRTMIAKLTQTASFPTRLRPSRREMAHSRCAVPAGLNGSAANPESEPGHIIGGSELSG